MLLLHSQFLLTLSEGSFYFISIVEIIVESGGGVLECIILSGVLDRCSAVQPKTLNSLLFVVCESLETSPTSGIFSSDPSIKNMSKYEKIANICSICNPVISSNKKD